MIYLFWVRAKSPSAISHGRVHRSEVVKTYKPPSSVSADSRPSAHGHRVSTDRMMLSAFACTAAMAIANFTRSGPASVNRFCVCAHVASRQLLHNGRAVPESCSDTTWFLRSSSLLLNARPVIKFDIAHVITALLSYVSSSSSSRKF